MSVRPPRQRLDQRRGSRRLQSISYDGLNADIDLDRTIDILAQKPLLDAQDIMVRDRRGASRAVIVCVDLSGSMRGNRMITMGAAVGALASQLHRERLGVVAFWSDAAIVHPLGEPVIPSRILDLLTAIPARGLTNVSWPIELAGRQLRRDPSRDRRILLLSDCVHNAGPDPRLTAAVGPRIDVLLDTSGESDAELAGEIARAGRGTVQLVGTHLDVAPALDRVFS